MGIGGGKLTLAVDGHVEVLYPAIGAEDLAQVVLVDVFGELLDNDLGAGQRQFSLAKSGRCASHLGAPGRRPVAAVAAVTAYAATVAASVVASRTALGRRAP